MATSKSKIVSASAYLQAKYGRLTFAKVLRANRKCENVSQSQAAKLLGISRQYLIDLELGRRFPSLEFAGRAAEKFGDYPESWQRYLRKDIEVLAKQKKDIKIPATQLLSMCRAVK